MEGSISPQELREKFHLSPQQLNAPISEEHLHKAKEIVCDPKLLVPHLGLTEIAKAEIYQEQNPGLQRLKMLKKWKQKYAWKATYDKLIYALLQCDRADLAGAVCKLCAQNTSTEHHSAKPGSAVPLPTSPLNHNCATSTNGNEQGGQLQRFPSDSPPAYCISREEQRPRHLVEAPEIFRPNLHQVEEEDDTSQLRQQIKQMKRVFRDLCSAAFKDLEERKVSNSKIRRSLLVHNVSYTERDNHLVAGDQHKIQKADTVHELFDVLSDGKCWDYLNPGPLKEIIDNHCSESHDIQRQKKKYLEQLRIFRNTTSARQFIKVCKVPNLKPRFPEVVFEMGKEWDSATLENVENLKQKLHEQGYISDHLFNIKRSDNCSFLSLVWDIPCGCPDSTTILHIPPSFYLDHGIRRVLVKGVCVVDVKFEEEQKEEAAKQVKKEIRTIEAMVSDEEAERLKELKAMRNALEENDSKGIFELPKKLSEEDILMMQHEAKERELLQVIKIMKEVEERRPTTPTGDHFVEVEGIRYNMELGGANGNTKEMMILLSVGNEFPAGVQVEHRVENADLAEKAIQTHGYLPPIVTGLSKEAAADLMATASVRLQSPNADLVRLCLDVPQKQRSKKYYLKIIEEFLKHCQQPLAVLIYLGHSERKSGNWCFKDGTISFKEIFDIYREHCPNKRLTIQTDCCYSGNWVKECAKQLDSLGIPPCGHRARERGILLKVYASCQPDQKAAEPCYSVKGVTVNEDGTLGHYAWKQASDAQTFCGTDFTKLACCRRPDESCQSEKVLKDWKWEHAVNDGLKSKVFIVRGKDRGQSAWYFVLLSNKTEAYEKKFLEQVNSGATDVGKWGYVIASGWGEDPPENINSWISM